MAGAIGTGLSYEQNAMAGFIRMSDEERRIEEANKNMAAQESAQKKQMVGTAVSVVAMILMAAISDERLKKGIEPFNRGLDDVVKINPISFSYLAGVTEGQREYAGVSAQNVQSSIPEAIVEGGHGYLSVDPMTLIATLINAVKGLKAEVEDLKKVVNK